MTKKRKEGKTKIHFFFIGVGGGGSVPFFDYGPKEHEEEEEEKDSVELLLPFFSAGADQLQTVPCVIAFPMPSSPQHTVEQSRAEDTQGKERRRRKVL